jgi:hypothetical protein
MRRRTLYLLVIWANLHVMTGTARAEFIVNGQFTDSGDPLAPFAGWTTTLGAPPTATGTSAVFAESPTVVIVQLEQSVTLPGGPSSISFEFRISSVAGGLDLSLPPDSFQATLWAPGYTDPFSPVDPLFLPGYYSIDNTGQEFLGSSFVSTIDLGGGWKRVTLDVSGVPSPNRLLEFILNGSDDGRFTTVEIANVQGTEDLPVIPAPGGLILLVSGAPCSLLALRSWRRRRACGGVGSVERN